MHRWGLDVKSNLQDNSNWLNADFEYARTRGPSSAQYQVLEESWWRQRSWGIDFAMQALTPTQHPLLAMIETELQALQMVQPDPSASGFVPVDVSAPIVMGAVTLSVDATTGAIISLRQQGGRDWASQANPLLTFTYQVRGPLQKWATHS